MKLLLSVISSNPNLVRSFQTTFSEEGATIGRNKDNTVVLADPQKYISSHHARIDYKAPDFIITDTSANGILINSIPLGKGNGRRLKDGDELQIGGGGLSVKYTISVKLIDDDFNRDTMPINPISNNKPENPFDIIGSDTPSIIDIIDNLELNPRGSGGVDFPGFDFDDVSSNLNIDHRGSVNLDSLAVQKHVMQFAKEQKPVSPPAVEKQTEANWWDIGKAGKSEEIILEKPVEPVYEPAPPTPPQPERTPPVIDVQIELIQNFLRGAKLENCKFAESITPQTFFIIGTMLRASVQGTRDVLDGRARIKNEMHLNLTLIKPRENNPIKFSVSTDDALINLLTPTNKAYLSPDKAISEAFDDIRVHQYSVIAGMKSALLSVLKRFDPKVLEERLQKQSPIAANIPIHKQAKLWELFEELYETIEHESQDNFYHLFGRAFAETYSQLKNKLKKDNPY